MNLTKSKIAFIVIIGTGCVSLIVYIDLDKLSPFANMIEFNHSGNKDERFTVSHSSKKQVKVLIWIMNSPNNLKTKARVVKNTWAKRADKHIFFS